ncbi:MAG: hypothetical protein GKS00_19595 [Alphaproteobacteria bacterium]|nr:hypothetical protein [Alphaproteobacteria bacterium]
MFDNSRIDLMVDKENGLRNFPMRAIKRRSPQFFEVIGKLRIASVLVAVAFTFGCQTTPETPPPKTGASKPKLTIAKGEAQVAIRSPQTTGSSSVVAAAPLDSLCGNENAYRIPAGARIEGIENCRSNVKFQPMDCPLRRSVLRVYIGALRTTLMGNPYENLKTGGHLHTDISLTAMMNTALAETNRFHVWTANEPVVNWSFTEDRARFNEDNGVWAKEPYDPRLTDYVIHFESAFRQVAPDTISRNILRKRTFVLDTQINVVDRNYREVNELSFRLDPVTETVTGFIRGSSTNRQTGDPKSVQGLQAILRNLYLKAFDAFANRLALRLPATATVRLMGPNGQLSLKEGSKTGLHPRCERAVVIGTVKGQSYAIALTTIEPGPDASYGTIHKSCWRPDDSIAKRFRTEQETNVISGPDRGLFVVTLGPPGCR